MDPEVLQRCIPGCEELERAGENVYRVRLKVRLGLVSGKFRGEVRIRDVIAPLSYTMEVEARGPTGFIRGKNSIRLATLDGGERTELHYTGEGSLGGGLASVGARLFQGAARSFSRKFFGALAAI